MSKKEPTYIHIESELGKKLENIKLGYFSTLAKIAMRKMDDDEQDVVNAAAHRIVETTVNGLNKIEDGHVKTAIAAIVAFNFATSLYLTIDEAMTAYEINETFGGDDDE